MKGTYDQVAVFISQVVNMQKMILIEDYSMTKTKQSNSQPDSQSEPLTPLISDELLEAELTLEIYSR
jgi:hypothetical protein